MSSIPTRRILTTSALAARPAVRSSDSPAIWIARAAFSSKSCTAVAAVTNAPRVAQQQQRVFRRQGYNTPLLATRNAARWSTTSATGSKIWSFEEIQKLAEEPSSSPKVTLIDVREPGELQSTGRIPGALNIPITTSPDAFHLSPEEFEDRFGFAQPRKEDEVVFYCKAGVRSRAAAGIAREAGWKDVGEFPGSWVEWVGKGGKVER